MLRQDRQSGTITRKQEGGGAEGQCYTEGRLGVKGGPSGPLGPPLSSHERGQDRRDREDTGGRENVCSFSSSLESFLHGSFKQLEEECVRQQGGDHLEV